MPGRDQRGPPPAFDRYREDRIRPEDISPETHPELYYPPPIDTETEYDPLFEYDPEGETPTVIRRWVNTAKGGKRVVEGGDESMEKIVSGRTEEANYLCTPPSSSGGRLARANWSLNHASSGAGSLLGGHASGQPARGVGKDKTAAEMVDNIFDPETPRYDGGVGRVESTRRRMVAREMPGTPVGRVNSGSVEKLKSGSSNQNSKTPSSRSKSYNSNEGFGNSSASDGGAAPSNNVDLNNEVSVMPTLLNAVRSVQQRQQPHSQRLPMGLLQVPTFNLQPPRIGLDTNTLLTPRGMAGGINRDMTNSMASYYVEEDVQNGANVEEIAEVVQHNNKKHRNSGSSTDVDAVRRAYEPEVRKLEKVANKTKNAVSRAQAQPLDG